MQYGVCPLNIIPIRTHTSCESEMISQLLYGEHFKILEQRKHWCKIRVAFDRLEGWIKNNQIQLIDENTYQNFESTENKKFTKNIVSALTIDKTTTLPIVLGSSIQAKDLLEDTVAFDGSLFPSKNTKSELITTALLYLNSPQLLGGRTPFGIDASGLTQMVYMLHGHNLHRSATMQASQGEPLSFIEECEPGDLAFFDNKEGIINHVGIIMKDNYIIHCHGKTRIDRIDHTGIFNAQTKNYTHSLRVIKKII